MEATDDFHQCPVQADGGVGPSVVPEDHDELLGLADIECKAVVLPSLRQLGYLVAVLVVLIRPISVVSSANLMIRLLPCMAEQSCVNREYSVG